jgi:two-component system sensor histidine kinase UhpB
VQETTRDSLDEIRRIARRLRPGLLADLGLVSAVKSLVDDVPRGAGLTVRTQVDPDLPDLSHDVELVIYRVAQESLTNAVRHAHACTLVLSLYCDLDGLTLRVRDDGVGMNGDVVEGAGIHGMRERALLIGADFAITAAPGGGTEVILSVPHVGEAVALR